MLYDGNYLIKGTITVNLSNLTFIAWHVFNKLFSIARWQATLCFIRDTSSTVIESPAHQATVTTYWFITTYDHVVIICITTYIAPLILHYKLFASLYYDGLHLLPCIM